MLYYRVLLLNSTSMHDFHLLLLLLHCSSNSYMMNKCLVACTINIGHNIGIGKVNSSLLACVVAAVYLAVLT